MTEARTAVIDPTRTYVICRPADDAHACDRVDAEPGRLGRGDDDRDQDRSNKLADQIDASHGGVELGEVIRYRGVVVRGLRG